jgi:hypothetical protein
MKLRYALLPLAPLALTLVLSASCGEETAPQQSTLCEPGSNIFCRCPGGDPGTKPCADDGSAFGGCECAPRSNEHGDCVSTLCLNGYCTMVCNLVSECPYPESECAQFIDGQHVCMPTCESAVDCKPFDAPPSLCGFTKAVDLWEVTVCANWDTNHALVPLDTDCVPFDHEACNLGYPGRELVCDERGLCAQGCFSQNDCPDGKTCNGSGAKGSCI